MTDVFAAYGHKATSTAARPLVGPMATRGLARQRFEVIVVELSLCSTPDEVRHCLGQHASSITQFKAELEFLWLGDGFEFLGLEREIERAIARVDAGLDFPRWEPRHLEEGTGL